MQLHDRCSSDELALICCLNCALHLALPFFCVSRVRVSLLLQFELLVLKVLHSPILWEWRLRDTPHTVHMHTAAPQVEHEV